MNYHQLCKSLFSELKHLTSPIDFTSEEVLQCRLEPLKSYCLKTSSHHPGAFLRFFLWFIPHLPLFFGIVDSYDKVEGKHILRSVYLPTLLI